MSTCILSCASLLGCARIDAAPRLSATEHSSAVFEPPVVDSIPGTYDAVMAQRGQAQFVRSCARCHSKPSRPIPHGAPVRFTKLRDLWRHPPYFSNGSAATLGAVVEHYDESLNLRLSKAQQGDLVEYLKSR